MLRRLGVLVVLLMLLGCDGRGDDDDDSGPTYDAEQLCRDAADAWGDVGARCFPDDPEGYETFYDSIIQGADGDCANVVAVRDYDELVYDCLPWMEELACSQLTAEGFTLDSSCEGQLIHN